MKNITRHTGKLLILKRLKNSTMGNPKFLLGVIDENRNGFSFETATNSGQAYSIENYENKNVTVEIGTYRNKATLHTIKEMGV
tara:strand:+ start:186 stop:434 length:249 start_codon:yes stop_codon:yes gene_type:complete